MIPAAVAFLAVGAFALALYAVHRAGRPSSVAPPPDRLPPSSAKTTNRFRVVVVDSRGKERAVYVGPRGADARRWVEREIQKAGQRVEFWDGGVRRGVWGG